MQSIWHLKSWIDEKKSTDSNNDNNNMGEYINSDESEMNKTELAATNSSYFMWTMYFSWTDRTGIWPYFYGL